MRPRQWGRVASALLGGGAAAFAGFAVVYRPVAPSHLASA